MEQLQRKSLVVDHYRLLAALKRCSDLLARFSPVGEMSPDVRAARAIIAQVERREPKGRGKG